MISSRVSQRPGKSPGTGALSRKQASGPRAPSASLAFSAFLSKLQGAQAPVRLCSRRGPGALASGGWGRVRSWEAAPRRELPEAISAGPGSTSPLLPLSRPPCSGAEDWGPRGTGAERTASPRGPEGPWRALGLRGGRPAALPRETRNLGTGGNLR